LHDLLDLTAEASAGGASLPQVQERVIPRLKSKYAEEFDPKMLALSVVEQVEKANRVVGEGTASQGRTSLDFSYRAQTSALPHAG
jgi:hypothetical protein